MPRPTPTWLCQPCCWQDWTASDASAFPAAGVLPRRLEASIAALRADNYLVEALGPALVETFCAIKESELQRFHAAVTDWEVREYAWHL